MHSLSTMEVFLIAMAIIFCLPYLVWRLGRTDYFAPLVVVQIITGIVLGPGVLGAALPGYYQFVFTPQVVQILNGLGGWAVMLFVLIAGIELDLSRAWANRRESGITAGLALGAPLLMGALAALILLQFPGWLGAQGQRWQFLVGVGMACAVTALPILILLMEKLEILRQPLRPAHPALRQPGRRGHLGRARPDPDGLDQGRQAVGFPGAVRVGGVAVSAPHGPRARGRPVVPCTGVAGDLQPGCRLGGTAFHGGGFPGWRHH